MDRSQMLLEKIISLRTLNEALGIVQPVDPNKTQEFRKLITDDTKELIEAIGEVAGDSSEVKFLLERLKWVLESHRSKLLLELDEVSKRQSEFQKFRQVVEREVELNFRSRIEDYFKKRAEVIQQKVSESFKPFENLVLMKNHVSSMASIKTKRLGKFISVKSSGGQRISDFLNGVSRAMSVDEDLLRSNVERIFRQELNENLIDKLLQEIFEECLDLIVKKWKGKFNSERIGLNSSQASRPSINEELRVFIEKRSTSGELTLTIGVGSATVATIGLAAGWHTLAYSFTYVFPPAALTSVIGAYLLSKRRKKRDIEERNVQVIKAVEKMKNAVLSAVMIGGETSAQGSRTLLERVKEANNELGEKAIEEISRRSMGALGSTEYRILANAISSTLGDIEKYWTTAIDVKDRGRDFENYVVSLFKQKSRFRFIEWRGDKIYKKFYPETNQFPDLEFEDRESKIRFAIECKYRSAFQNNRVEISYPAQLARYRKFSKERAMSVFVVLGIGGTAKKPEQMYLIPIESLNDTCVVTKDFVSSYPFSFENVIKPKFRKISGDTHSPLGGIPDSKAP